MAMKRFEAYVRQEPQVVVLDLAGEINALAEQTLNNAYAEAEKQAANIILLNFSKIDYINSTGIALIVGLLAKARKSKRQLFACGLSDHYRHIFELTRLSDAIHIFATEADALAAVR